MKFKTILTAILSIFTLYVFSQNTTSSLSGNIVDENKNGIYAAVIYTKLESTGSAYGGMTNEKGNYLINNISPGGPYTIKISFMGYKDTTFRNVYIKLGDDLKLNVQLKPTDYLIKEVQISASKIEKQGQISSEQIKNLPTLTRNISDFNKLTPKSSNNSFNGTNFRYNNITLDGSINNDAIGFSASLGGQSGTSNMPGSSTRTSAISLDAIQDMQVVIAPFDVKLGNFTGGSINAITKSGTNEFSGSVYSFGRNGLITGRDNVSDKTPMSKSYYDYQSGLSFGLPLKKDKLFLFFNGEQTHRNEPLFYSAGQSGSFMTNQIAQRIVDSLSSNTFMPATKWNPKGTYNPGSFGDYSIYNKSTKLFARLDYNMGIKNKLSLRTNFVSSSATNLERSVNEFQFSNFDFKQNNLNSSSVFELKTQINNKLSNNFIGGFTYIHDWRDPQGDLFPQIQINNVNGGGRVFLGTNREAGVFNMKQKTIEITNNLTFFTGKHKFTFGTHNEIYFIDYGFVNSYNGRIDYNNLDDFFNNKPSRIRATYNLTNNDRGYNMNNPSAKFNINLLSGYIQDDWNITNNFKFSPGVRIDLPILTSNPNTNLNVFNNTYTKNYGTTYTHTEISTLTNKLFGKPILSPRIGFNWNVNEGNKITIRGGSGIFTGRIPFAWLGYAFYNNGTNYGSFDKNSNTSTYNIPTNSELFSQYNKEVLLQKNRTEINLVDNNFKMPQVLRSSLASDIKLKGYVLTLEGIFTKTIHDVMFKQINLYDSVKYYSYDTEQLQPIYLKNENGNRRIDDNYTSIFLMTNTNLGYRYSLSATLKKEYKFGLGFMTAYNFGRSFDISNGIRNSFESNWQLNQSLSPNNPNLTYSNFDVRHRIITSLNYKKVWNEKNQTTLSLFFSTQSGSPFTWVIGSNSLTNNGQQVDLAYIPKDKSEIVFKSYVDSKGNTITSEEQWNEFNQFIENDEYLKTRRGKFTERNGGRTPWNTQLDLRLIHDIKLSSKNKQSLQITFDIVNLTNLINPKLGWQYFVPNTQNASAFLGLNPTGSQVNNLPEYKFVQPTTTPYSIDKLASRWQCQIGIRYNF